MYRLASALAIPLLLAGGCTSSDEGDLEFRNSVTNQNPDLILHEGESTDNPDCIIWDIKDGCSHEAAPDGPIFRNELSGDDLVDLDGNVLCYVDGKSLKRASDGTTMVTLHGNRLEDGDGDALYSFAADHIFTGHVSDQQIGYTSDANLSKATPGRKLQIGSLLLDVGDCQAGGGRAGG